MDERYPYKTVASFSCNSGYSREGNDKMACLNLNFENDWTGQPPTCKKEGNLFNILS